METEQNAAKRPVGDWTDKGKKNQKFLESNENENRTYQNLQDTVRAMLKGKFIAVGAYVKKKPVFSNKQPNDIP
jgi:hypothetical protein